MEAKSITLEETACVPLLAAFATLIFVLNVASLSRTPPGDRVVPLLVRHVWLAELSIAVALVALAIAPTVFSADRQLLTPILLLTVVALVFTKSTLLSCYYHDVYVPLSDRGKAICVACGWIAVPLCGAAFLCVTRSFRIVSLAVGYATAAAASVALVGYLKRSLAVCSRPDVGRNLRFYYVAVYVALLVLLVVTYVRLHESGCARFVVASAKQLIVLMIVIDCDENLRTLADDR